MVGIDTLATPVWCGCRLWPYGDLGKRLRIEMKFEKGRCILMSVTSAVTNPGMTAPQRVVSLNRPNMVSVGTIVFLSQELMFFAGLFAMWFTSRANGQAGDWTEQTEHLNVIYGLIITAILITSSVTSQFGVLLRDDLARRNDSSQCVWLGVLYHHRLPYAARDGGPYRIRHRAWANLEV